MNADLLKPGSDVFCLSLPTMWHLHRVCGSCSPCAGGIASLEWSGPLLLIPEATTSA